MAVLTLGTNISALAAQRRFSQHEQTASRASERLASGQRIVHPSDDAAGLAISTVLHTNRRLYTQALRNANDGISALAIQEGAIHELTGIVTRIMELAAQTANGSYSVSQRRALNEEAQQLSDEYTRIVDSTSFNGLRLFDSAGGSFNLQVGIHGQQSSYSTGIGSTFEQTVADGTADSGVAYATLGSSEWVHAGDFNEDGKQDILTSGGSAIGVSLLLGNGDGTFAPATQIFAQSTRSSMVSDWDHDGHLDMVVDGSSLFFLHGNGNGTFSTSVIGPATVANNLRVADFNADGDRDLLAYEYSDGSFDIYLGNGNGTFETPTRYNNWSIYHIAVADFDNDGYSDALAAVNDGASNPYMLYRGNPSGTFSGPAVVATGGNILLWTGDITRTAGDINNDGNADIVANSTGGSTQVYLGNGNGTFRDPILAAPADASAGRCGIVDINEDGMADLVRAYGSNVQIGLSRGDGYFEPFTTVTSSVSSPYLFGFADFNGDDAIDIVASTNENSVSVMLSNSTISQSALPEISINTQEEAAATLESLGEMLGNLEDTLGQIGAQLSRLDSIKQTLYTSEAVTAAAESRIMDADMAEEAATAASATILQRTAAAVATQANLSPQIALDLLRSM